MSRSWWALTLCALAWAGGCKSKSDAPPAPASGTAAAPAPVPPDAPAAAPAPDAVPPPAPAPTPAPVPPTEANDTVDPKLLVGAKTIAPDKHGKVDATAIGPAIGARLVERLGPPVHEDGVARGFQLLLVLTGSSTIAVDLGKTNDNMEDPANSVPADTLVALDPITDMQAELEESPVSLKDKAPRLYHPSFSITGSSEDFVVSHDGNALVVWHYIWDEGTSGWAKMATIALAPNAKVDAK